MTHSSAAESSDVAEAQLRSRRLADEVTLPRQVDRQHRRGSPRRILGLRSVSREAGKSSSSLSGVISIAQSVREYKPVCQAHGEKRIVALHMIIGDSRSYPLFRVSTLREKHGNTEKVRGSEGRNESTGKVWIFGAKRYGNSRFLWQALESSLGGKYANSQ